MIDHSYSKYSSLYGSGGSRGGARGAQVSTRYWLHDRHARHTKPGEQKLGMNDQPGERSGT